MGSENTSGARTCGAVVEQNNPGQHAVVAQDSAPGIQVALPAKSVAFIVGEPYDDATRLAVRTNAKDILENIATTKSAEEETALVGFISKHHLNWYSSRCEPPVVSAGV